jgi:hypothetical protein
VRPTFREGGLESEEIGVNKKRPTCPDLGAKVLIKKRQEATFMSVDHLDSLDSPTFLNASDFSTMPSNAKRLDEHLAPIEINERREATGPRCNRRGCRASDKCFLPIPTAAYLELLDWTARQIRNGKRGSTPKSAKPIFERLGISGEVWCELVKEFGRLFMTDAGKPQEIDSHRSRSGGRRYKAKSKARELLAA